MNWQLRQLHREIRELGGGSSYTSPRSNLTTSHIEAALSEKTHQLAQLRSTPAGVTTTPTKPMVDFAAELNRLRETAAEAKRKSDQAQSESTQLQDELTKLNTQKDGRLERLAQLEKTIKARRIDLGRDLENEEEKLREIQSKRRRDSGTGQLKNLLERKEKQLAGKEKIWYGFSQAKQKGSLTEGGRKKEEQALRSEVRGLKAEVRALQEQLKKTTRVSETVDRTRKVGKVLRQQEVISEIKKEIKDINDDWDRERKEHDDFMAAFHKREQEINAKLTQHREAIARHQREEQDQRRKQKEIEDRQRQHLSESAASSQSAPAAAGGQVQQIEQQINDLREQKRQVEDKKYQKENIEMQMQVMEREIQMFSSALAQADPQQIATLQGRIRPMMNEFNQTKEDLKKLMN